MSTNQKPVAKALHTVTVLIQVIRLHESHGNSREMATRLACDTLGFTGREDPQGLVAAALKQMGAAK